jgi:hypothetical protein
MLSSIILEGRSEISGGVFRNIFIKNTIDNGLLKPKVLAKWRGKQTAMER